MAADPSQYKKLKPLPKSLIESAQIERVPFNAEKHICFEPPKTIYTMEDIGIDAGISNTAISSPFPLFTPDAVRQIRAEILSEQVLSKYQCSSDKASNMVRGHCPEHAPFTHNAWNSPAVLSAISKIAGMDLVPAMNVETGHVNISLDETGDAFDWHVDSYAFVCITMLSDCTGMEGGETAIRTGTSEVLKFRGPDMGTAVVMQGRYIEHKALAMSGGERISMVTAFRARSPFIPDETVIKDLIGFTPVDMLYAQYAEYRLENMEERLRRRLEVLRERREFDVQDMRRFLLGERAYLDDMLEQLS
ncbi:hypothetical protein BDV25DRAFT_102290 [Aspergillus avenaceus]|uniref:Fe2OG dioxygenase domain-containing protein n=1 Tax=Aspergillus avenaceus TaxID=36643 RepID=A0A5N6TXF3_ASPAV|nr:hypothetical protein BDV25DRAFT_102290 [Aspergillus avenaceus]